MKILILKINNPSHYEGDTADYAVVHLGAQAISRIKELAAAVQSLGIYKVVDFHYACVLKQADYDQGLNDGKEPLKEDSKGSDCDRLNVTESCFFWSGYYKHTDARWETNSVPLAFLDGQGDLDQRGGAV